MPMSSMINAQKKKRLNGYSKCPKKRTALHSNGNRQAQYINQHSIRKPCFFSKRIIALQNDVCNVLLVTVF
jgi:hypothetical protein